MALTSFAEVVSIGVVLPFLGVLVAPERVILNPMLQPLTSFLGVAETSQLLFLVTVLFIVAALFSGVMRFALLWTQTRLSFAIGADLSAQIYKKTLYQPYSVHVLRNSSQIIASIATKTNIVIYDTLLPILLISSSSLIMFAILVLLVIIDPIVALITFGSFGGLYITISLFTRNRLSRYSQDVSRQSSMTIKALQEGLGGIRDVLIDGTQDAYCKIYQQADLPMRRSQANIQIISGMPRPLIESIGIVLIALFAYGLTKREAGVAGAIPVLGALALGAQRLLPALQQLYASRTSIRGGQASLQDVLQLLDQPMPSHVDQLLPEPIPFNDLIQLKQIGFYYADEGSWVLRGISLQIRKGSRIGFIGTTGSGKSTLLDLIMGLLQPKEGALVIDGLSITTQNHRAWQSHIAHVPQNIFLVDGTVTENIAFGVPYEQIDHIRVIKAARQAQIDSTIESWHMKYETLIGEHGVRISGGQRQRIGIARALYKMADVIVFDEATSALDVDTEFAVMDSINHIAGDTTILIVAHRLSTLKNCDVLFEIEHGRLKRTGSFAELMTN